jgi:hypothetical protein
VPVNLWGEIDDLMVYIDYVEGRSDVRVTSASAGRLTASVTRSSSSFVGADKMAAAELTVSLTHRRYTFVFGGPEPDHPNPRFSLFSSVPPPHTDTWVLTSMVIPVYVH